MDLMEEDYVSCGVENCSKPDFWRNCSNQDCQEEETMAEFIVFVIFGLLGNTLTLLVVWLHPNMRSTAHLYLSSMAVSDLLILLLLALDLLMVWTDLDIGVFACKLIIFLSECCIFCTILHITFLSLERYLVVCRPITSKMLVTHRRTWALIGCLWLGAALSVAPFSVMMEVDHKGQEDAMEICILSPSPLSSGLGLAILIIYNLYVLVPLCILGLVYILIGRTLRLRPQRSSKDNSHRHAVKMLGVIFLAFVLCWLPYIVALTMNYGSLTAGSNSTHNYILTDTFLYFFVFAWILSRLSAAINPLVYNLMSARMIIGVAMLLLYS
ncbi:growth hormone secretagogue receptor type 1-like [Limanda limanda]|uniref:growth hormone secretagogue receptor type 1-like n=1 Tax=Limanda limanda TaxID=27771 RepID=UPI0029C90BCC|nr:growth hormone secretagogue receptor type 1-like [Limanda limanda]